MNWSVRRASPRTASSSASDGVLRRALADYDPRLASIMLEPVAVTNVEAMLRGPNPEFTELNRAELEAVCVVLMGRVKELEEAAPDPDQERLLTDLRVSESRNELAAKQLREENQRLQLRYRKLQQELRYWKEVATPQPPVVITEPPPRSNEVVNRYGERIDLSRLQRSAEFQDRIQHEQLMEQLGDIEEALRY